MKQLAFDDSATKRVVNAHVPHGVVPKIVTSIYPDGSIGLRELGRRDEYKLDIGTLYVHAMMSSARKIEKRAKEIKRATGSSLSDARKKAKKEILK